MSRIARPRSVASSMARTKAPRTPLSSRTANPAIVVPPGEETWSLMSAADPGYRCRRSDVARAVWRTKALANSRGMPTFTAPSSIPSRASARKAIDEPEAAVTASNSSSGSRLRRSPETRREPARRSVTRRRRPLLGRERKDPLAQLHAQVGHEPEYRGARPGCSADVLEGYPGSRRHKDLLLVEHRAKHLDDRTDVLGLNHHDDELRPPAQIFEG